MANDLYQKTPVKIIYVAGSGRSGSTILDIILGNHPEIESFGEISYSSRSFIVNDYSENPLDENYIFWTKVKNEWSQLCGENVFIQHYNFQKKYETFRSIPRLILNILVSSKDFKLYLHQLSTYYAILSKHSNSSYILDSSKNPIRAYILTLLPEINIFFIHLIRDGRGVAYSRKKSFKKDLSKGVNYDIKGSPVWKSAFNWIKKNLITMLILKKVNRSRSIQIKYEDIVLTPSMVLSDLGKFLNLNFDRIIQKINNQEEFKLGYIMGGNRLRKSGELKLKPDLEWKAKLKPGEKFAFWLIAGWLAMYFKYKK